MSDLSGTNPGSEQTCRLCGTRMEAHTLRGLCPNCLALFALAPGDTMPMNAGDAPSAPSATIRYVGDYELQEEIGRGGMGVVFKARQVSLNRIVAVKMILSGEYAGPEERRRFQREAESAAQLRHPNIVAIHEVGEHEGRSYFSMDYIEGKSLARVLEEETFTPARAAGMVKILAEAVHFAHQRGTLHRDLKPQNILVGEDGRLHILDFGLARPIQQDVRLTQTGQVMGSPSYMPPEQAAAKLEDIGPASDVYALGVILYEMLAGDPPFVGGSPVDVLSRVVNQDPVSPRSINSAVPTDLETICLKCLEKRPERRYHSARGLAEELERFTNFEPILARPAGKVRKLWNWTQRNPWIFAAIFGVLTVALLCLLFGFWEHSRILQWRLDSHLSDAGGQKDLDFNFTGQVVPKTEEKDLLESLPTVIFLLVAPGLLLLMNFLRGRFRNAHLQDGGTKARSVWRGIAYTGSGVCAAIIALAFLLLQIRYWMWHAPTASVVARQGVAFLCAGFLGWIGLRMVWESIGIHETSRYRATVLEALMREQGREKNWRRVFQFIAAMWLIGSVAGIAVILYGVSKPFGPVVVPGAALASAFALLAFRAIRTRQRLFTYVILPGVLVTYIAIFIALAEAVSAVTFGFLLIDLIFALQTAWALFCLRAWASAGDKSERRFPANPWLDVLYGLALTVLIFIGMHAEENWRGHRMWDKTRQKLEDAGLVLDWKRYTPPPVPDDQNIFKAYDMNVWFQGHGVPRLEVMPYIGLTNKGPLASNFVLATISLSAPGKTHDKNENVFRFDNLETNRLVTLLSNALQPILAVPQGFYVINPAGGKFRPVPLVIETERGLSQKEMAAFIPTSFQPVDKQNFKYADDKNLRIEPDGPVGFRIIKPDVVMATALLSRYQTYSENFRKVEEALQRPFARFEGDYSDPMKMPFPNFVELRNLTQAFGAWAEMDFLAGEPADALKRLTLIHKMGRIMQGPPGGQPETLVAAMINVAIGGIYAGLIDEGLQRGIWDDVQLAELQRQLSETHLPVYVDRAFEFEIAVMLELFRTFSTNPRYLEEVIEPMDSHWFDQAGEPRGWNFDSLVRFALVKFMPNGWLDINKSRGAEYGLQILSRVRPHAPFVELETFDQTTRFYKSTFEGFTPFYAVADVTRINYTRALSTSFKNQTGIMQALVVCGLERYRLAHHEYPENLDQLVPQFLDKVPVNPIGGARPVYQRTDSLHFKLSSLGTDPRKPIEWPDF